MDIPLTAQERRCISALERLEKDWPDTLWIFAASGTLCVMKNRQDWRAYLPHGGVDPDYEVASSKIPCDGGDW